jgi:small conductance mechanosensitive channel
LADLKAGQAASQVYRPLWKALLFGPGTKAVDEQLPICMVWGNPSAGNIFCLPESLTNFDPSSFAVRVSRLNNATILVATDRDRERPLPLVTVTRLDADYYGVQVDDLAKRWQTRLYSALHNALEDYQPYVLRRRILKSCRDIAFILIGTLGLWFVRRHFKKQAKRLRKQMMVVQEQSSLQAVDPEAENLDQWQDQAPFAWEMLNSLGQHLSLVSQIDPIRFIRDQFSFQRQLKFNSFIRWLIIWIIIVAWFIGARHILSEFPFTKGLSEAVYDVPPRILGVIFLMNLFDRVADLLIDRCLRAWAENEFLALGDLQRKSLRYATVMRSLQGLTTVIFSTIGFLWCLDILGVSLLPLLTGGAIIGSAIALIFQDFIRDFAQGCLILWEDQYAIGDVVIIGSVGGLVENMNLRVTQLRNSDNGTAS